ncbi:hypothetical protein BDV23DRAFT_177936 [Aspergillus alliaceus]|uniref:Uncharacterized protein n=1 Tax=Petromyces alliaceus TaxID=209559 RepID=A0A5N7CQ40_PETAA|nr:hypothetical protein BDV23DRAFT_177936 [Aspergillus alliaceus]
MGFLQLIPAEQLYAFYKTETRILTLVAEGQSKELTSNIEFAQQTVPGLFKFDLEGWVGPLTGKSVSYKREQNFHISIPSQIHSVIIVDANHPHGQQVPIQYIPRPTDGSGDKSTVKHTAVATEQPAMIPETEHLFAQLGTRFSIKESKKTASSTGSISIKFDKDYLKMADAAIKGENIVWTFDPIKVGTTQVVVVEFGGHPNYVTKKTYDVNIVVA